MPNIAERVATTAEEGVARIEFFFAATIEAKGLATLCVIEVTRAVGRRDGHQAC